MALVVYRESLEEGVLSGEAKRSTIIPLHKGDSLTLLSNYRPVSITSHLVKAFEGIMRKHIVTFLERCNLLLNPNMVSEREDLP